MSKTDRIETTEGKTFYQRAVIETHNKKVDALEHLKCFSEYTSEMEIHELRRYKNGLLKNGDDTIKVMLSLPLELVWNAINVCKEVNEKYAEEYGDEWGLKPFDVLVSAYNKTDLMHYPEDVVETETERFE